MQDPLVKQFLYSEQLEDPDKMNGESVFINGLIKSLIRKGEAFVKLLGQRNLLYSISPYSCVNILCCSLKVFLRSQNWDTVLHT